MLSHAARVLACFGFRHRENIGWFLESLEAFGVPGSDHFMTNDLYEVRTFDNMFGYWDIFWSTFLSDLLALYHPTHAV